MLRSLCFSLMPDVLLTVTVHPSLIIEGGSPGPDIATSAAAGWDWGWRWARSRTMREYKSPHILRKTLRETRARALTCADADCNRRDSGLRNLELGRKPARSSSNPIQSNPIRDETISLCHSVLESSSAYHHFIISTFNTARPIPSVRDPNESVTVGEGDAPGELLWPVRAPATMGTHACAFPHACAAARRQGPDAIYGLPSFDSCAAAAASEGGGSAGEGRTFTQQVRCRRVSERRRSDRCGSRDRITLPLPLSIPSFHRPRDGSFVFE